MAVAPPPPECAKVTLANKGWQLLSFNCIGNMSNTFDVLATVPWQMDDKILSREGFLKFASFDGDKWVDEHRGQVQRKAACASSHCVAALGATW